MTRPRNSVKDRRECFEANRYVDHLGRTVMDCHLCGGVILPAREDWECDHTVPHALDGNETRPAHPRCHQEKTKSDVGLIAKGKRVRDRNFGVVRASGTMPGSKKSKFRKKINGTVERRDA